MRSVVIACTALLVPLLCKAAPDQKDSRFCTPAGQPRISRRTSRSALIGQLHKRISQKVRDPLTATALALEMQAEDGRREQALLISCDLLYIRKPIQDRLRQAVKAQLPDLDVEKLFLNATHTHTGPGFADEDFGTPVRCQQR